MSWPTTTPYIPKSSDFYCLLTGTSMRNQNKFHPCGTFPVRISRGCISWQDTIQSCPETHPPCNFCSVNRFASLISTWGLDYTLLYSTVLYGTLLCCNLVCFMLLCSPLLSLYVWKKVCAFALSASHTDQHSVMIACMMENWLLKCVCVCVCVSICAYSCVCVLCCAVCLLTICKC